MITTAQLEKEKVLAKIKKAKERLDAKTKAIEELVYEKGLILNDFCNILENDLRLSRFNVFRLYDKDIIARAHYWLHYASKDPEKIEDSKSYKSAYESAKMMVTDSFFGFGKLSEKAKLKNIIEYAGHCGYDFVYAYGKEEITIFVPDFGNARQDVEVVLGGYQVSIRVDEIIKQELFHGLDYEEVAVKLQNYILENIEDKQ